MHYTRGDALADCMYCQSDVRGQPGSYRHSWHPQGVPACHSDWGAQVASHMTPQPGTHHTHTHDSHRPWLLLTVTPGLTQPGLQLRGTHRGGSATPQCSLGLELLLHLLLKVPDYRKQQGTLALS